MDSKPEVFLAGGQQVAEHCRRVAAVTQCITHQQFLETEAKQAVFGAALVHHVPAGEHCRRGAGLPGTPAMQRILAAVQNPAAAEPGDLEVEILRAADAYDTLYQRRVLEPISPRGILDQLRGRSGPGTWRPAIVDSLAAVMRESALPYGEVGRLPVFRAAALRAWRLLQDDNCSLAEIESAAALDPSIAAQVLRAANSALFMGRVAVTTLRGAVMRLGFQNTRRVLISAIFHPVFASAALAPLMAHSAQAADVAAQIAERTGVAGAEEAFLCGLLHDLGKLCLDHFNLFDSARMQGLLQHGCPAVYAENLLLGRDHGYIGGQVAASWRLPADIATALRFHHVPEQTHSVMARILYLVEWVLGHEEDVHSPERLDTCLRSTGLSKAALRSFQPGGLHEILVA